jgi:hypothetical protein
MNGTCHFPTFAHCWSQVRARRFPRVRLIMRRLMVTVVSLAVVAAGYSSAVGARRYYVQCMGRADGYSHTASHLWLGLEQPRLEKSRTIRRAAEWYDAMARKYRRAAWRPWLLLMPDPHKPWS